MKLPLLRTLLLGAATASAALAFDSANLVKNAGFDEAYENGLPADWTNISHPNHLKKTETTLAVVPEGPFLRVTRGTNQAVALGEQRVALAPDTKQVRVAVRLRSSGFTKGDADWQVPGISFGWVLADGSERQIGPGTWLLLKAPSAEWKAVETVINKPADAAFLKVSILGIGWTGQVDLDDLTVEPL